MNETSSGTSTQNVPTMTGPAMWLSPMGTLSVVKAIEHMQDEGCEQWPLGYSNVLSGAVCSGWAPQFVRNNGTSSAVGAALTSRLHNKAWKKLG